MNFFLPIDITGSRTVEVRFMTNSEYGALLKFALNETRKPLNAAIDEICKKILKNESDFRDLNYIDKIIILFQQRIIILGSDIMVSNENVAEFDLNIIFKELYTLIEGRDFVKVVEISPGLTVNVGLHKSVFPTSDIDIVDECIQGIYSSGGYSNWTLFSQNERDIISAHFGMERIAKIIDAAMELDKEVSCLHLTHQSVIIDIEHVSIGHSGQEISSLIVALFKMDFREYMKRQFIFINKIGGSMLDFEQSTMGDIMLLINLYNEDIHRQNQSEEKARANNP